jgi:hypothetical protein
MSEPSDRNRADEILGEDWAMPGFKWYSEAWESHPQREELNKRKGEVGEDGFQRWQTVREYDADDGLIAYWQRPVEGPNATERLDAREPILICSWPKKREDDALADARAIVEEHDDRTWK